MLPLVVDIVLSWGEVLCEESVDMYGELCAGKTEHLLDRRSPTPRDLAVLQAIASNNSCLYFLHCGNSIKREKNKKYCPPPKQIILWPILRK